MSIENWRDLEEPRQETGKYWLVWLRERAKEIAQTRENLENLRARIIAEETAKKLASQFQWKRIDFDESAFQKMLEQKIAQVFNNPQIPRACQTKISKRFNAQVR